MFGRASVFSFNPNFIYRKMYVHLPDVVGGQEATSTEFLFASVSEEQHSICSPDERSARVGWHDVVSRLCVPLCCVIPAATLYTLLVRRRFCDCYCYHYYCYARDGVHIHILPYV